MNLPLPSNRSWLNRKRKIDGDLSRSEWRQIFAWAARLQLDWIWISVGETQTSKCVGDFGAFGSSPISRSNAAFQRQKTTPIWYKKNAYNDSVINSDTTTPIQRISPGARIKNRSIGQKQMGNARIPKQNLKTRV